MTPIEIYTILSLLFSLGINPPPTIAKVTESYRVAIDTPIRYGSPHIPKQLWAWKGDRQISKQELQLVIELVLYKLPFAVTNKNTTRLLLETAAVESMLGSAKLDGKVGLGVFGILEKSAVFYLTKLDRPSHQSVMHLFNKNKTMRWNLAHNVPFSVAVALVIYKKTSADFKKRTSSVEKRGALWKQVYNTPAGKGTVSGYVVKARYTR